ncbi:MAG: hypothetical protein WAL71_14460 [Terriglobales bacterium]
MTSKAGTSHVVCAQCEHVGADCMCEKYCILCRSMMEVRLCTDGLMYCEDCRTACDYQTAE